MQFQIEMTFRWQTCFDGRAKTQHTTTVCITCATTSKAEWRIHSVCNGAHQKKKRSTNSNWIRKNMGCERILNMNDRDVTHWPIRVVCNDKPSKSDFHFVQEIRCCCFTFTYINVPPFFFFLFTICSLVKNVVIGNQGMLSLTNPNQPKTYSIFVFVQW